MLIISVLVNSVKMNFFKLKTIKTYLRLTIYQTRLNGLNLIS